MNDSFTPWKTTSKLSFLQNYPYHYLRIFDANLSLSHQNGGAPTRASCWTAGSKKHFLHSPRRGKKLALAGSEDIRDDEVKDGGLKVIILKNASRVSLTREKGRRNLGKGREREARGEMNRASSINRHAHFRALSTPGYLYYIITAFLA